MPGLKTNEVPGTRAVLRHYRMSAYKARQVLDLVRGMDVDRAEQALAATPREAARVVSKVLASAVANARNNEQLDPDDLYVSACYADEGATLKRWRPRARGRATRIRKRTCHITVIVSRLPDERLERRRARQAEATTALRSRRVAASRRGGAETETADESPATPGATSEGEELDQPAPAEDLGVEDEVDAGDGPEAGPDEDGGEDTDDAEGALADTVPDDDETEAQDDATTGEVELEAPDADTEAGSDEAAEGDDPEPTPGPRRARAVRKRGKKATGDASGDEERD